MHVAVSAGRWTCSVAVCAQNGCCTVAHVHFRLHTATVLAAVGILVEAVGSLGAAVAVDSFGADRFGAEDTVVGVGFVVDVVGGVGVGIVGVDFGDTVSVDDIGVVVVDIEFDFETVYGSCCRIAVDSSGYFSLGYDSDQNQNPLPRSL